MDAGATLDTFTTQCNRVKPKLVKPVSASVRRLLNNSYFPSWTTAYMKHMVTAFQSKDKKCPLAMEYFGTNIKVEEAAYMKKLKDFWKAVRTHAKDKLNIIAPLSRFADLVPHSNSSMSLGSLMSDLISASDSLPLTCFRNPRSCQSPDHSCLIMWMDVSQICQ